MLHVHSVMTPLVLLLPSRKGSFLNFDLENLVCFLRAKTVNVLKGLQAQEFLPLKLIYTSLQQLVKFTI